MHMYMYTHMYMYIMYTHIHVHVKCTCKVYHSHFSGVGSRPPGGAGPRRGLLATGDGSELL